MSSNKQLLGELYEGGRRAIKEYVFSMFFLYYRF